MKILAVDDDGVSLTLLQECLAQGGYEYMTFMSSPTEVIKVISDTAIPYDCILLDVEMPGKSGIQLCAEIRELARYRNTPILMITKRSDHTSVKQAFRNGATDYITKPFEFFEVLTRLKVAERLIQERQAAIDSYVAIQDEHDSGLLAAVAANKKSITLRSQGDEYLVESDQLLSFSIFQNFLEKMTQDSDCAIDLVAIKIRRVGEIFKKTTATEFINFLEATAKAAVAEFGAEQAFITHIGDGIFLCASQSGEGYEPAQKEAAFMKRLSHYPLPSVCEDKISPEIIVGSPLSITVPSKLNFRRAVKAATARMEERERSTVLSVSISVGHENAMG